MTKAGQQGDFKEKEKVHVVPTRKGEELHFSVVELDGKQKADIRYFSKNEDGLRPTHRGIVVDIGRIDSLLEGTQKLKAAISK